MFLGAAFEAVRLSEDKRAGVLGGIAVGAAILVPILLAVTIDDDFGAAAFGVTGMLLSQDFHGYDRTETALGVLAHVAMAAAILPLWWRTLRTAIERSRSTTR